uniref:Uncharacterized protein n=1 Tax=Populus trichocarpa TaxID=3694 RepID=A0A2K1Y064_POPTR
MDMKFKNFLALLYPLMFPVELNKLKVKLIIFTGWETSEIVDVIHDIKHMMGDVLFRLQSNALYGLACELPYSPRRYTVKNFVKFGGARDTDHPEIRQPSALDIWTNLLFA